MFGQHLQRGWNGPLPRGQAGLFGDKDHINMDVVDAAKLSSSGSVTRLERLIHEGLAPACDQVWGALAIVAPDRSAFLKMKVGQVP